MSRHTCPRAFKFVSFLYVLQSFTDTEFKLNVYCLESKFDKKKLLYNVVKILKFKFKRISFTSERIKKYLGIIAHQIMT